MSWHHKRERGQGRPVAERDPIVYDIRGVPVGVRIADSRRHESETPASRYLARVRALRTTRELEGREWITLGLF
jgi:hypothetical protein